MPTSPKRSPFERADGEGTGSPVGKPPVERGPGRPTTDKVGNWMEPFLDGVAAGLSIKDAAHAAGVHFTTVHQRRRRDEEFRKQWNQAADIGTRLLEQEAARRAYHGTLKPVFNKGVQCGTVREYSDTLMIFMLKARRPEKYRDGGAAGGQGNTTINIFERVQVLQQQLQHGQQPAAVVDAGVPGSALPGLSGGEHLDSAHTDAEAVRFPADG